MLLLAAISKPYIGKPMTLSHLPLSDFERSKSRSLGFRSIMSRERAQLGHKLVLNINRNTYMESSLYDYILP